MFTKALFSPLSFKTVERHCIIFYNELLYFPVIFYILNVKMSLKDFASSLDFQK